MRLARLVRRVVPLFAKQAMLLAWRCMGRVHAAMLHAWHVCTQHAAMRPANSVAEGSGTVGCLQMHVHAHARSLHTPLSRMLGRAAHTHACMKSSGRESLVHGRACNV